MEAIRASMTSSSERFIRAESSATLGDRPRRELSSSVALASSTRASWRRRGTWTAQEVSRKNRLISPTMQGTAKVVNSTSREMSKRSMALIRPIVPTWTMSSMSSPRARKRPAA